MSPAAAAVVNVSVTVDKTLHAGVVAWSNAFDSNQCTFAAFEVVLPVESSGNPVACAWLDRSSGSPAEVSTSFMRNLTTGNELYS